jgi:hypothetical protein
MGHRLVDTAGCNCRRLLSIPNVPMNMMFARGVGVVICADRKVPPPVFSDEDDGVYDGMGARARHEDSRLGVKWALS